MNVNQGGGPSASPDAEVISSQLIGRLAAVLAVVSGLTVLRCIR
jgi:hypothetical protein